MAFSEHLRADQDAGIAAVNFCQLLVELLVAARGIAIDAIYRTAIKQLPGVLLCSLRTQADRQQRGVPAVLAVSRDLKP